MFKFIRYSLATKISLFTSVLVLITVLLVTYVFFITSRDILIEKEFHLLRDQSYLVRDNVRHADLFFNKQLRALKRLAQHVEDSRTVLSKSEYGKVLDHELDSWLANQEYPVTLTFVNADKKSIQKQKRSSGAVPFHLASALVVDLNQSPEGALPVELAYYEQELVRIDDKSVPLLHYIVSLPSQNILVTFQLNRFFNNFISHSFGDDSKLGSVIFFNNRGEIISHPNDDKVFAINGESFYNIYNDFPFLRRVQLSSGHSLHSQLADYRGSSQLVSVNKAAFISFMLMISQDKIFSNLSETIYQLAIMIGGLVFFFTFLAWFLSRFFLKELALITHIAKRFIDGEHNLVIPISSNDEIGTLALTIQGLIRQVQEREKNLKRSERTTREARDHAEKTLESKSLLLEDLRVQKRNIENMSKDKDDLLAIVSHDLKNPLSVVDTSMNFILEEDEEHLSTTSRDLIRRSKSSTQMALTLITDLLDLARLEGEIKLDIEQFYVNELVNSVVDSYYHIINEKSLQVNTLFVADYDLQADYGRMNQVIANLLGNACKFTPAGGTINITVDKAIIGHDQEVLQIVLADNGPGIPADKMKTIFNKYEQARAGDRKVGTGLGLAICQKICELHEGTIWADSEEGKGASFTVQIPGLSLHQDHLSVDKHQEYATSEDNDDRRMIMIVDEDKDLREFIVEHFADLNIRCLKAKNGAEAMFLLKKYPVEIVISDMRVPIIDGLSLAKMIRESHPTIEVMLTTASFDDISDRVMHSLGLKHVFAKPFDLNKMSSVVKRVLLSSGGVDIPSRKIEILPARKRPILVIDDSEDMHSLFKALLKKEEDLVVEYGINGKQGLAKFLRKPADVVFIDMNMPELSGVQTLTLLKKLCHDRGVKMPYTVLLTAHDLEREEVVERMGFDSYIQKPINKKKILQELAESQDHEERAA